VQGGESSPKPDFELMQRAIELAGQRMHAGHGGPFGALVVKDGQVIAEGWNQVTSTNDPTAHAEIMAIRKAAQSLGSFSLAGCALYSSCEPCPMCLAAAYWARVDAVFFAGTRRDADQAGFVDGFLYDELAKPLEQRRLPMKRLDGLRPAVLKLLQEWREKEDKVPY